MKKLNRTEKFFIIGIIIAVFVLIIIIIFSFMNPRSQTPNPNNTAIPTNVPLNNPSQPTTPVIKLNEASEWKLAEMLMSPPTLSASDESVKNAILAPLNGFAGNLHTTPNVTVFYLPSIKEFGAKIETTNIALAKKEAVDWLTSKGMSQQGVCHLPLEFYLNYDAQNNLRSQNVVFDPLPPGC
jgi:hypothetical protein